MGGLFKTKTISNTATKIAGFQINSATYGAVVPFIYGTTRISGNVIDYFDFTAIAHTETQRSGKGGGTKVKNTTYTYTVACLIGLGEGPISGVGRVWKDEEILTSPAAMGFTVFRGEYGQQPWSYTQSKYPEKALPYSGLAYVAGIVDLGDSGGLPVLNFEIKGHLLDTGDGIDANPAAVIHTVIFDSINGVGFGQGGIDTDGADRLRTFCKAADLLISSPPDADTKKAYEIINEICDMTNTITFWSQSRLKLVPLCDESISANGTVYIPDNTPLYDLDEDDFLEDENGKLVVFERSDNSEAFNQTTIEFVNRKNGYEVETVNGEILTDIHRRGLRPADTENIHYIHTKERAQYVADIKVMKSLYGRNKYIFRLDWSYCLLEPGDLLTLSLTNSTLKLNRQPVIIDEVEEAEDGELEFVTIAKPPGIYAPGKYAVYEAERPNIDYRVDPGNTTADIFNSVAELTTSGLEVWIAASGDGNWGGCNIWVSDSGDHYESTGEISGPSRHGVLTEQLPAGGALDTANVLQVQLIGGDQLLGGSEQDAQNLNTLCWVDGELIAYANATLTGDKQYTLTYLIRGVHNTPITPHAAGAKFVRLDTNLFKHPFTIDQVGKTVYLKLTAYNIYGIAEQSLSDVEAIAHTLTADLPPDVSNITLDEDTYILKDGTVLSDILVSFTEPEFAILDHYNIYYDENNTGQWTYAGPATSGTGYRIKALKQAQTVKVKVCTVSKFSLESTGTVSASYTITGKGNPPPDVASLVLMQDEYNRANIVLTWAALDPAGVPDLKGYEARLGQDWNSGVKINSDVIVGNTFVYAVSQNGSYAFLVKAIDNSGNYSAAAISQSITANITPDAPANLTATQDPKDRSVAAISWTASPGKDIEGYQITVDGEIYFTRELSYRYTMPASGTYEFSLKAKTVAAYYSAATNTSLTATIEPYDVTGFTAAQSLSDRTKVTLYWDNPINQDVAYFVIKKGVSWDAGTVVAPRATGTFYDVMVAEEIEQTFWIKAVSIAGKYSQFPAGITGIYNLNPDPATNIQINQDPNDKSVVNITWTGIMESDLSGYQVKIGYVWEMAEALPLTKELKTTYSPAATGDLKVMIKSINAAGFYSDEASNHAYITLEPLDVTGLVAYQNGETVELYWEQANEADVTAYEIREGANFDQGALIATGVTQSQYIIKVDTERNYQYWIKAINRSGHYSQNAAAVMIYVTNLPVRNVIATYDEIVLKNGTHNGTEFGPSLINFSNMSGRFSDYPTTKFSDVGGETVLKLAKDSSGNYFPFGIYSCARVDVDKVITANITAQFISTVILKGSGSAKLQIRTSQDGTNWAAWQDFKPVQHTFRYADFQAVLGTEDRTQTPEVNQCVIHIDVPDFPFHKTVTIQVGGTTVSYGHTYYQQVILNPAAIGEGLHAELVSKTLSECVLKVKNASNTDVGGQIDLSGNGF